MPVYSRILGWRPHYEKVPRLKRACAPLLGHKISVAEEFKVTNGLNITNRASRNKDKCY